MPEWETLSDREQEIEIVEVELALLIRKLIRLDLYAADRVERVLRQAKHQDVIETVAH